MSIETMCAKWLERNFGINPEIGNISVLPQAEIDKVLGLVGVEFDFTYGNGHEGNSTAFLDYIDVSQALALEAKDVKIANNLAIEVAG
jgi:hypothetical protein